jgi:putative nucleotidyltransferase with HDIG domain
MKLVKNEKVINILEETLNHVDTRLVDHGKRVAYLIYKVLEGQHKYDSKKLRDICVLTMLHDVGAYKTEEIDRMVVFETVDIWEHSIYGYLFLRYFSPLKEMAPVILFHHAECNDLKYLDDPEHQLLAQLISLCDRSDVFALHGGNADGFRDYINQNRNVKYYDYIVDMFFFSFINIDNVFKDIDTDETFNHIFRGTPLSREEVNGYIKMIIFSIDFRSSQTVIHTVATTCIAGIMAGLLGVNEDDIEKIKTGAMLHDIGKIGIPIHILESTDRLNDADMEIMRGHVDITEKILRGNVDADVEHIAVNHHERLNGTGYPKHFEVRDIAFFDRIVVVADIFSALCGSRSYKTAYPKEKIIRILSDMSGQNLIDPEIAALSIKHYDEIMEAVERESQPVIQAYNDMNEEYQQIRNEVRLNRRIPLKTPKN